MNKDVIIVILIVGIISLMTYLFIYPYLEKKMLDNALNIITSVISYQLKMKREVLINIEGKDFILIDKTRCNSSEPKK